MILMIDNFDSFTYNLVQAFQTMGAGTAVFRNDAVGLDAIESMVPCGIVISPGPGAPKFAGISVDVIGHFYKKPPNFIEKTREVG